MALPSDNIVEILFICNPNRPSTPHLTALQCRQILLFAGKLNETMEVVFTAVISKQPPTVPSAHWIQPPQWERTYAFWYKVTSNERLFPLEQAIQFQEWLFARLFVLPREDFCLSRDQSPQTQHLQQYYSRFVSLSLTRKHNLPQSLVLRFPNMRSINRQ